MESSPTSRVWWLGSCSLTRSTGAASPSGGSWACCRWVGGSTDSARRPPESRTGRAVSPFCPLSIQAARLSCQWGARLGSVSAAAAAADAVCAAAAASSRSSRSAMVGVVEAAAPSGRRAGIAAARLICSIIKLMR